MEFRQSQNDPHFEQALGRALDVIQGSEIAKDAAASLSQLQGKLVGGGRAGSLVVQSPRKMVVSTLPVVHGQRVRYLGVLAAIGVMITAGIAGWQHFRAQSTPVVASPDFQHGRDYITAPGQRATITLNDGTEVLLNVATKLVIPDGFGTQHRTVQLDGEAKFTVVHSADLPFVVDANGTAVRDLATVFAVRSYHGNGTLTVAVNEGRVSVQPATLSSGTVVDANRVAIVTEHGAPIVRPIQNLRRYFGWTNGQLVLSETSLADALVRLSQWYGMEFRAADSALLSLDVTATLPEIYDQEKMNYMAATLGARFERQGDTVTLVSSR